jgi:hypothetical protein
MSDRDIRIIPLLLEPVQIPLLLRDRLYVDLSRAFEAGLARLAATLSQAKDPCVTLPASVLIEAFNAGTIRPNELGGMTLVYHENGDPLSLQRRFPNRGGGRALGLQFDFTQRQPNRLPPRFVGYATRLQLADWNAFVRCGYWLCFDCWSNGNAMALQLEVKRLTEPPREDSRQEVAKWRVDLTPEWETKSLQLSDISFPNASWDNMWEICFVLFHDLVIGDHGLVQIDKVRLSRTPGL